jgi:hypothetical protein
MSLPQNNNLLKEYPNVHYLETGVWRGDSIQMAIDAGFSGIFGIDADPECIEFCKNRFALNRLNHEFCYGYCGEKERQLVEVIAADSAVNLWRHIERVTQPITFFLDAHFQMIEGEYPGANPFPLLKELEQIGRHPIKTHTIIVDDWHIFYRDRVGYSKNDVKNAILQINPAYRFTMAANPVIDGILIAHL